MSKNQETVFSKIIRKEIPAEIVYETDDVLAFKDIAPKAPVHILIIPKKFVPDMRQADRETLGLLFETANIVAKKLNIFEDGFRTVVDTGTNGGQEVFHLHVHLLGGGKLGWTPA